MQASRVTDSDLIEQHPFGAYLSGRRKMAFRESDPSLLGQWHRSADRSSGSMHALQIRSDRPNACLLRQEEVALLPCAVDQCPQRSRRSTNYLTRGPRVLRHGAIDRRVHGQSPRTAHRRYRGDAGERLFSKKRFLP